MTSHDIISSSNVPESCINKNFKNFLQVHKVLFSHTRSKPDYMSIQQSITFYLDPKLPSSLSTVLGHYGHRTNGTGISDLLSDTDTFVVVAGHARLQEETEATQDPHVGRDGENSHGGRLQNRY